ncbi:uncharacterized protein L969DRAFT_87483 [Mixia osmundae IAM 14324]|nr:uncharacterized protein L969DRAFT_87483 [Mixia osmundae IAM 14324]KEI39529.1 hypothetical protein L969DRAFT_87483 [Mixia osmundae IAM 14324]
MLQNAAQSFCRHAAIRAQLLSYSRRSIARQQSTAAIDATQNAAINVFDLLEARGMVKQSTSNAGLRTHLENPRSVYLGIDPTAESLHVGHLLGLVALGHFQRAGHEPIILIGGGTGTVGDPTGRSDERIAQTSSTIANNARLIKAQVEGIFYHFTSSLDRDTLPALRVVNNRDWLKDVSLLEFLAGPAKYARVSQMLARDSAKTRLESQSGMSFTEFTYQLLQAYDFLHLHAHQRCTIQLGGSDQWGNIQSGIDLINRRCRPIGFSQDISTNPQAFGITVPLLQTAAGEKFGKSAGNAIWLDRDRTNDKAFSDFFRQTRDTDVRQYLQYFTFLPSREIDEIMQKQETQPGYAQEVLAEHVTRIARGQNELDKAKAIINLIQGGSLGKEHFKTILDAIGRTPEEAKLTNAIARTYIAGDIIKRVGHHNLLVMSGMAETKSQARKFMATGSYHVNGDKLEADPRTTIARHLYAQGAITVARGRRSALHVFVVHPPAST